MAFCKYSIDMLANNTTSVDNIFINNYLPYAKAEDVKVYLYGLYKCQDSNAKDNTLENFANEINMTQEDVEKSFTYWQEQGLVQLIQVIPFEVRFLPLSDVINNTKKYNVKKYESFNAQAQEILAGRMITPNEYREYYDIIERLHMEKEALLMIIAYCVNIKGDNVGYAYITTIAKDWANQKITTSKQVEERLMEFESLRTGLEFVCKLLGIKRTPSIEERGLYQKWTQQGFGDDVLTYVAKKCKEKGKSNLLYMDTLLDKYYSQRLLSVSEIELYEDEKTQAYALAKTITKNLGLYYENLEPVVDNYIFGWISMGFTENMLTEIANYCFKTNVRTLDGMNRVLEKFHKLGILTENGLAQFFEDVLSTDKKIKSLLESIGLSRNVNQFDRDKYKVWKENWNMPDDIIDYACTLAIGKDQPMQYLASLLASFHDKKITTLEDAKKSFDILPSATTKSNFSTGRSYTREEMNSLFQSIEEIEI
ncbi:MAG: DnaD domain protein [Clostridia bacterium]|nr:DnaD domain protein [Clostridia bacterium]